MKKDVVVQEAEALQAEVKLLQAEASQLRRDNELRAEVESQCARRGAAQVTTLHTSVGPSCIMSILSIPFEPSLEALLDSR